MRGPPRSSIAVAVGDAPLLEGDPLLHDVRRAPQHLRQDDRVAHRAHAEVGCDEAVRVLLGVLHEHLGVGVVDGEGRPGQEPAPLVPADAVADGRQEVGDPRGVAGRQDQRLGPQPSGRLLLGVVQVERVAASVPLGGGHLGGRQQGRGIASGRLPSVELVEDRVDRVGADPLGEGGLAGLHLGASRRRQRLEVRRPLGRGHLQRQLGVLHREEARRARDPGQLEAVALLLREQVGIDLGRALPAADHGDRAAGQQVGLAGQVVRRVQRRTLDVERQPRRGAGAEHEVPATPGPARRRPHEVGLAVVLDRDHALAPADGVEAVGGPPAVVVVLAAERVEALADVERVEPADVLEEGEVGEARGRVGERDQVGEERHLERRVGQHHPGVPREAVRGLEEDARRGRRRDR